jgi:hypothetical protein
MILDQRNEGDYLIYGGAIEAANGGGFIAAVVVNQLRSGFHLPPKEIFRDDGLASSHRWPSLETALAYAMDTGSAVARAAQGRIAF